MRAFWASTAQADVGEDYYLTSTAEKIQASARCPHVPGRVHATGIQVVYQGDRALKSIALPPLLRDLLRLLSAPSLPLFLLSPNARLLSLRFPQQDNMQWLQQNQAPACMWLAEQ